MCMSVCVGVCKCLCQFYPRKKLTNLSQLFGIIWPGFQISIFFFFSPPTGETGIGDKYNFIFGFSSLGKVTLESNSTSISTINFPISLVNPQNMLQTLFTKTTFCLKIVLIVPLIDSEVGGSYESPEACPCLCGHMPTYDTDSNLME